MSSTDTLDRPAPAHSRVQVSPQRFGDVLGSEWIKFWSVRSTGWSVFAMLLLGAGLTVIVCATSAEWLASAEADEASGSFVTWGMMIAQVTAVVLGALVVTSEYGTGMIRTTFAATPRRSRVLLAKAVVLGGTLLVVGTVTAVVGYLAGNQFLDAHGVGVGLGEDGMVRSLFGSGLYVAGLGLFSAALGLLLRHTAAVISVVLALVFVVGNMVFLIPGEIGEWIGKLLPGNAGQVITTPVPFNPDTLAPWTGFGVFVAEIAVVVVIGWVSVQRRDA